MAFENPYNGRIQTTYMDWPRDFRAMATKLVDRTANGEGLLTAPSIRALAQQVAIERNMSFRCYSTFAIDEKQWKQAQEDDYARVHEEYRPQIREVRT